MAKIILKRNNMKKIFISIFLISFVFNFANAEEIKQTKQVKETKKKELSKEDEEIIARIMKNEKELKEIDKLNNPIYLSKSNIFFRLYF